MELFNDLQYLLNTKRSKGGWALRLFDTEVWFDVDEPNKI